ncbi:MAG: aminotransferase class III-fold pyridoxal phosphate-dependent enzyme, partial [Actinobacteria bacterium]|nr:aminotransferase class III-fold pyridoxal phosphate-dependent enzyme [Actinomycetota bacterium]
DHLRVRTLGHLVRCAALLGPARPRDLRQGRHLRISATRRSPGLTAREHRARVRPRPGPAPRAHLLRSPGCAAALAAIEITRREELLSRALVVGKRLRGHLNELCAQGAVAEVRGDGAVWAVGLHDGADAPQVREEMLPRSDRSSHRQ